MILIDLSSAFHKCVHGLTARILKETKEDFVDLKQYKREFNLTLLNILCTHIQMFRQFSEEIIICVDDRSNLGNWRKRIYPMYKFARRDFKQNFKTFDYADAYLLFNEFLDGIKGSESSSLFRVIDVDMCEADDLILVLGRYFADQNRNVLVLSPDKDFIQLQTSPMVKQYSWMTNKAVEVKDPEEMQDWLLEHVCLGDLSDNVPRIVDFKEFKPGVKEFLVESGQLEESQDAWSFSSGYFDYSDFDQFDGVFEREKFGFATLKKQIEKLGSLEAFLDLHPVHRKNYYRNRQLVLEEGIPTALKEQIIDSYNNYKENNLPASTLVQKLGISGCNLPDLISNKYISEQQLGTFLDW